MLTGSCRKHHCGQRCNKKLNCAGLNWKWTTWPKRHLNFKRLGGCTFCCPLLINEGNYLGWESAHAAAAPTGIRMLTLPGPPQQLAAQRLKLKLNSLSKTQTTFAWIPGWDMKLMACRLKLCCSISEFRENYWLWLYNVCSFNWLHPMGTAFLWDSKTRHSCVKSKNKIWKGTVLKLRTTFNFICSFLGMNTYIRPPGEGIPKSLTLG